MAIPGRLSESAIGITPESFEWSLTTTCDIERIKSEATDEADREVVVSGLACSEPQEVFEKSQFSRVRERAFDGGSTQRLWQMLIEQTDASILVGDKVLVGAHVLDVREAEPWPAISPAFYRLTVYKK